jgi:hypothetical protein
MPVKLLRISLPPVSTAGRSALEARRRAVVDSGLNEILSKTDRFASDLDRRFEIMTGGSSFPYRPLSTGGSRAAERAFTPFEQLAERALHLDDPKLSWRSAAADGCVPANVFEKPSSSTDSSKAPGAVGLFDDATFSGPDGDDRRRRLSVLSRREDTWVWFGARRRLPSHDERAGRLAWRTAVPSASRRQLDLVIELLPSLIKLREAPAGRCPQDAVSRLAHVENDEPAAAVRVFNQICSTAEGRPTINCSHRRA